MHIGGVRTFSSDSVTSDRETEGVCDLFWFCAVASHFSFSDEKNCDSIPAVMNIKLLMLERALSSTE